MASGPEWHPAVEGLSSLVEDRKEGIGYQHLMTDVISSNAIPHSPEQAITMSIQAHVRLYRFPRYQRLKKKKLIDTLFKNGEQEKLYPILFFYHPNPDPEVKTHKVLFSVPRKLIRKAVDRNKVKRRLREAYRKNKYLIEDNLLSDVPFHIYH